MRKRVRGIEMNNRIKELRKKKNISQGDVAKALDVTRQAINQYEIGKCVPTPEIWDKLADYFDVSIEYLKGYMFYMCKNCGRCFIPEPNASRKDMEYCPNCIDWLSL